MLAPPPRNSLTTVTRLRTNNIFASTPLARPLCYTIMEEVASVARAKGLSIPGGTVEGLIKKGMSAPGAGLPSSMMGDCLAGRPMEVEVGRDEPHSFKSLPARLITLGVGYPGNTVEGG